MFRLKDRAYTMTLSNIGPVQMEPEYADLIERFHLMIGVSRRQPVKCAVCAYKDEMVITFLPQSLRTAACRSVSSAN